MSAIYAAFKSMIEIEKTLELKTNIDKLEKYLEKIKEYCMKNFINDEDRTLKRSNKDNICDISILGTIVPFDMFNSDSREINNTLQKIEMTLKTYTGGYIRFEGDNYMGGNNPWPIATLWMSLYNFKNKNLSEAIKQFNFVTNTASDNNLLAEQIDNSTMKPKWVTGLGWSHAMYSRCCRQGQNLLRRATQRHDLPQRRGEKRGTAISSICGRNNVLCVLCINC